MTDKTLRVEYTTSVEDAYRLSPRGDFVEIPDGCGKLEQFGDSGLGYVASGPVWFELAELARIVDAWRAGQPRPPCPICRIEGGCRHLPRQSHRCCCPTGLRQAPESVSRARDTLNTLTGP